MIRTATRSGPYRFCDACNTLIDDAGHAVTRRGRVVGHLCDRCARAVLTHADHHEEET